MQPPGKQLRAGPKLHRAFSGFVAGLAPAIHVFVAASVQDVDAVGSFWNETFF
jgi:hypothetical protein